MTYFIDQKWCSNDFHIWGTNLLLVMLANCFNDESFKGLSGFHCRFNNLESQILKTCREQRWSQHFYFWGQKSFSVWFLDIYPSSWQRFKNLITTLSPRLTKLVIWWLYNEQTLLHIFMATLCIQYSLTLFNGTYEGLPLI